MTSKTTLAVTAIVCLVVGGAAGYFGRPLIQPSRQFGPGGGGNMPLGQMRQPGSGDFRGMQGQNGQRLFGGGRVTGQVQSVADGRLTIQTPNDNSQIVLINGNTTYQKMTSGSASDVTTGAQVVVMGQQNPDGSTTATSVQIIPEGMNIPTGARQTNGTN